MKHTYILKRMFDIVFSVAVLVITSPILIIAMVAVWAQDRKSPFYKAQRVGKGGTEFTMIKLRSMVVDADKTGVNSTGATDARITKVGNFIRRYKIDELSQFFNVLRGDMSVVGPRPNTFDWGVSLYSEVEQQLLLVRPGITDLSSIIFSDEGEILKDFSNADLAYNQLIRPWKSRLGLIYIKNISLALDIKIIWLTALAILHKNRALKGVGKILKGFDADWELIQVCQRETKLSPTSPPGMDELETGYR